MKRLTQAGIGINLGLLVWGAFHHDGMAVAVSVLSATALAHSYWYRWVRKS